MKEMLENRLAAKKEELKKKQEYFQIGIQNIKQPSYNDLLYMKKLKTEIAELELMLQMFRVYEDGNK